MVSLGKAKVIAVLHKQLSELIEKPSDGIFVIEFRY